MAESRTPAQLLAEAAKRAAQVRQASIQAAQDLVAKTPAPPALAPPGTQVTAAPGATVGGPSVK